MYLILKGVLNIEWVRVGQEMNNRHKIYRNLLQFNYLQRSDLGEYSCIANNHIGSTNLVVNLFEKNKKIRHFVTQHGKKLKLKLKSENEVKKNRSRTFSKIITKNDFVYHGKPFADIIDFLGESEQNTNKEINLNSTSSGQIFFIKYLNDDEEKTQEKVLSLHFPPGFTSILNYEMPVEFICKTAGMSLLKKNL